MRVTSKVDYKNLSKFKKLSINNLVKAADALKSDLVQSQTMPFDTGKLQNRNTFIDSSKKEEGVVCIVSDTPYARRVYFHPEFKYKQDKNAKAGGLWFNPYISGTKKTFLSKAFSTFMRKDLEKCS